MLNQQREGHQPELGWELTDGYGGALIRSKVRRMCRQLSLGACDAEELEQELRVELYFRARKFNPARGDWPKFLRVIAARCASTLWHRVRRRRATVLLDGTTMSADFSAADRDRLTGGDTADEQRPVDLRLDAADVLDRLDPPTGDLCSHLMADTVSATARELGAPQSTLADRVRRLQKPFASLDPHQLRGNSPLTHRSHG